MHNTPLYLIHDNTIDPLSLSELVPDQDLVGLAWCERETPPYEATVLAYLNDAQLRDLTPMIIERQWVVGVLPHSEAKQATRALGVKGDLRLVINHYLEAESIEADVLTCNDQVVFNSVVIGEVLALRPYDPNRPHRRWGTFVEAVKAATNLRLQTYKLTTGKEQKIQLAALGMVVMKHTQSTLIGRSFSDMLSISDGRLTVLALAPRSFFCFFRFLVRLLIFDKINLSRLPDSVGLIRSKEVVVEMASGVDYSVDGVVASAKEIEFRVLDQRMRLLPGPSLVPSVDHRQEKDQIKVSHLPMDETARKLVMRPLPLVSRASEEEYRDLFTALRESAALSSPFLVLMVLSVLLALTGLYANSAPVIIGAMILAPLMSPIISLSMGLARTDSSLIRNSIRTLASGVGLGLVCAIMVAWLMPLENLTAEMQARLSPTLLDLSVAVISGVAGAYAHAKEAVAKSLAGVAIAVALVPPLSVAGIGVGWSDWEMARGAFLLFTTNLVGISLAASATFLVLGFAPFTLARKGLAMSFVVTAIIGGPLYLAFLDLVEQGQILRQVPVGRIELAGEPVRLRVAEVRVGTTPLVRVVLSSSRRLTESHVDALKELISKRIGGAVLVEAQFNVRR